jgi:Flp pilus assembly protein TadD
MIVRLKGRKQRKEVGAAADRGLRLLAEKRYQEAHEGLAQAVQQFPDDPELRMHYAHTLLAVRPEKAVPEVAKAIELEPNEPIRLTRAAGILFKMGQVETARSHVTHAKELAPPNFMFMPDLIHLDGHFAALEEKNELAEKNFRVAVEQAPTNAIFAVDLARFLSERGQRAEALEVIDEAMARTENKEPLQRLRGELGKAGS